MRKTHRCSKCKHGVVLHITEVADVVGDVHEPVLQRDKKLRGRASRAWRIARVLTTRFTYFTQRRKREESLAGLVEAFICHKCGYTELYTRAPDQIPIDGQLVRWLEAPQGQGAYR